MIKETRDSIVQISNDTLLSYHFSDISTGYISDLNNVYSNQSFDLDKKLCKKEAIAYGYYTFDNYLQRANVDEYREFLKSNDKVQFSKEI